VSLCKLAARPPNSLFGDVHAIITALRRATDVHQVFSVIAQACQRVLGAVGLVIAMPSEKDHALHVVHTDGAVPAVLRSWESSARQQATPLSDAMQRGEILELMSPQEISERYADLAAPSQPPQALVCAPVVVTSTHMGALGMSFEQPPDFSDDKRQFLQILCSQMAETLARLHHAEQAEQARITAQNAVFDREAFLSTAAHEIRTPLTLILGQAQLVQRRLEIANPQHQQIDKSLDVIVAQTQRLSRLMTSMVSVFQLEDGLLELKHMPLDLNELAASAVRELQQTILTHAVTFAPASGPAIVAGDPIYLEQILHHLVQNAARFSESNTEIHVAVKLQDSHVQLIVRDHGNGIPVKDVAELFQRFSHVHGETPQHRRGIGIGLYLVREVVERHQGSVVVENAASAGSQFTITLPLAIPKTPA
jgi:K+-sensing histidine kinase KdpD